jgi:hypothetical protein
MGLMKTVFAINSRIEIHICGWQARFYFIPTRWLRFRLVRAHMRRRIRNGYPNDRRPR